MRRLLLVGALLLCACTPAGARPHLLSRAAPSPRAPSVIAPAAARVPTTTAAPAPTVPPTTTVTQALDQVLFNTNSCLVVTDNSGTVLYRHAATAPFTPASTQKLLVAAAALDELGPDYRFATSVVAAGPPVAGVEPQVWLVGGGDPLLASPEYAAALAASPVTAGYRTTPIAALADQLAARGIKLIPGGIRGDDGHFSNLRELPTWSSSINNGEFDIGPLGALEVDQGKDSWKPIVVRTADPTGHGAGVLARLLTQRGVVTVQGPDSPAPPGGVVLAAVQSAPLSQIVAAMLQASDNQIAELLVREIDKHAGGSGTTAGGVRRVMADAAALGLPSAGLSLVDGSGLSRANTVTCSLLLAALNLGDQPRYAAMSGGLPVAGVNGTLTYLFRGTPIAGHLAAKGGYITGVTALVGRLPSRRFAFIANGAFDYSTGIGLTERVVQTIAGS